MKPVYSHIEPSTAVHTAGIVKLLIAPREWLSEPFEKDFTNNKVLDAVAFLSGKTWLHIEMAGESIFFNETPKNSNAGEFYEVSTGGVLNYMDAALLQQLETMRYHEWVVVTMDRKKKYRIAGTYEKGMQLSVAHAERADDGGESRVTLQFFIETESLPPYYEYSASYSSS